MGIIHMSKLQLAQILITLTKTLVLLTALRNPNAPSAAPTRRITRIYVDGNPWRCTPRSGGHSCAVSISAASFSPGITALRLISQQLDLYYNQTVQRPNCKVDFVSSQSLDVPPWLREACANPRNCTLSFRPFWFPHKRNVTSAIEFWLCSSDAELLAPPGR
ncbi:uncharacterized protein YALI1_A15633g [Yarrowia lipolytica]|uniref:Uncharacterized protein n=1 Tax=Yarrowia lipolytica TaxID=4952 RepID=A0A1D8N511_YARLL|nr:hypothetical protein YALI1_A15633g [Yarrowia lipolytica]